MQDKIVIGQILKPQGIRGELKIKPLLDDVALVKKFKKVFVGGTESKVLSARFDASAAYLALSGVADRNAAELLRGKEVEVLRADAPALEEGRYYIVDVIGCSVIADTGERLGEITDILSAHTDIYVMQEGDKEFMFPAADGVIADVDVENKIVTVNKVRLMQVLVEQ